MIIWNIKEKHEEYTLTGHNNLVFSVKFTNDSKFIISGSRDCSINIWNVQEKRKEFILRGHKDKVSSVVCSPDFKFIISGSNDNTVRIWSVEQKKKNSNSLDILGQSFQSTFQETENLL